MSIQGIRKGLILSSFLFFPLTIYYFSPVLIIMGAREGIITGSFLVFAFLLVISLFLGRAICGWLCPAGGLQECCAAVNPRKAKGGKMNWIKFAIWVPWLSVIGFMIFLAGGLDVVNMYYQTDHGISISKLEDYIIYYFFLVLIVGLALTAGKRSFCHYICWMAPFMIIGTKLGQWTRLPRLRIQAESDKCTECETCSQNCPMSLGVTEMVQKGRLEDSECILCGTCVDVCPVHAIQWAYGTDRKTNRRLQARVYSAER